MKRHVLCFMVLGVLVSIACNASSNGASLLTAPDISWANPTDPRLQTLGPVSETDSVREDSCTRITYRTINDSSKTMHQGCFVQTASGLYDERKAMFIAHGTDEAIGVVGGSLGVMIKPIPHSGYFGEFDAGPPGSGGLTFTFHSALQTNLVLQGRPALKNQSLYFARPAQGILLKQPSGKVLPVHNGDVSFSPRGLWMISEAPGIGMVRVNLATHEVFLFGQPFSKERQYSTNVSYSVAITDDGRYAAVSSARHNLFRVYDLKGCQAAETTTEGLVRNVCPSREYWSNVKSAVTGDLKSVRQLRFIHDGLISLTTTTSLGIESHLLSPNGPPTSLLPYIGIGDSFASGEGAWNYRTGTDTDTNRCHTSIHSYPLRLSRSLFSNSGQSVACSGARIHDITNGSLRYAGQNKDQSSVESHQNNGSELDITRDFTPGYLPQEHFVRTYLPGSITVQVGGNDIGFAHIILRCVSPLASIKPPKLNDNHCYKSREDRLEVTQGIDRAYQKWVQLYKNLRSSAPQSRIYAVGYPHIVSNKGSCGLNAPLSAGDRQFARHITAYLNTVISQAAKDAGVYYVDIEDALEGIELCSGAKHTAVNGITAGTDKLGILGQESFHPNAFGHERIEAVITKQLTAFRTTDPPIAINVPPPEIPSDHPILNVPASGRTTTIRSHHNLVDTKVLGKGNTLPISFLAEQTGLKPGSTVTVQLGETILGTYTLPTEGPASIAPRIPQAINTDLQVLTVTGANISGHPITLEDVVYVEVMPGDSDGDTLPNQLDSCPLMHNNGIDADSDGIDDACDPWQSDLEQPLLLQPLSLSAASRTPSQKYKLQGASLDRTSLRTQRPLPKASLHSSSSSRSPVPAKQPPTQSVTILLPSFIWQPWLAAGIIAVLMLYWLAIRKMKF